MCPLCEGWGSTVEWQGEGVGRDSAILGRKDPDRESKPDIVIQEAVICPQAITAQRLSPYSISMMVSGQIVILAEHQKAHSPVAIVLLCQVVYNVLLELFGQQR